ncbi:MAG: hypothetical protein ACRELS_04720, partial [Candidatus Rokuibacteriota bacterium]
MARVFLVALVCSVLTGWAAAPATAQPAGPVFRIEEDPDAPGGRRAISGWVYNDGRDVAGLVQLRLQVLDASNQVIAEEKGWVYGNVRPGGRAYFRIAIPATGHARRIIVESFV